ncbi:hypothetical protein D3C75_495300 [compost metagenome]
MQHKRVVETLMRAETRLAAKMVILFMDLRGLGESGLLLMHRLGDKDPRIVFIKFQQQRRAVCHHWDKLLVTHPCGVKQDVVAQLANLVDHLAGVVNRPVISAKLDHRQAERTRFISLFRCHGTDLLAQECFVKAAVIDAANKAKRVTRRFKIHRRGPGLDQRPVMVRFVVIAVEQHQIAAG